MAQVALGLLSAIERVRTEDRTGYEWLSRDEAEVDLYASATGMPAWST